MSIHMSTNMFLPLPVHIHMPAQMSIHMSAPCSVHVRPNMRIRMCILMSRHMPAHMSIHMSAHMSIHIPAHVYSYGLKIWPEGARALFRVLSYPYACSYTRLYKSIRMSRRLQSELEHSPEDILVMIITFSSLVNRGCK